MIDEIKAAMAELEYAGIIERTGEMRWGADLAESADGEMRVENLGDLLDRVSKNSTGEIDSLIGEFQRLRGKLQTDGERIKREIEEYGTLSQLVIQMTNTVSESVEKVRATVAQEKE